MLRLVPPLKVSITTVNYREVHFQIRLTINSLGVGPVSQRAWCLRHRLYLLTKCKLREYQRYLKRVTTKLPCQIICPSHYWHYFLSLEIKLTTCRNFLKRKKSYLNALLFVRVDEHRLHCCTERSLFCITENRQAWSVHWFHQSPPLHQSQVVTSEKLTRRGIRDITFGLNKLYPQSRRQYVEINIHSQLQCVHTRVS